MVSRETVESWIALYERAWRTAGTDTLNGLFSEGASYSMSPYEEPAIGLETIGELWEREREGPDEEFELRHEIVATEGDTAVIRAEVEYGRGTRYRDLWIVRFAGDGRCREFEEWPFWPGKPTVSYEGGSR
jgi:hypothetical protein